MHTISPAFYGALLFAILVTGCAGTSNQTKVPEATLEALLKEQQGLLTEVESDLRAEEAKNASDEASKDRIAELRRMLEEIKGNIKNQNRKVQYINDDALDGPYRSYVDRFKAEVNFRGRTDFPTDHGQKIYGFAVLMVTIAPNGSLADVEIVKASSEFIAAHAVRLLRENSPYQEFPEEIASSTKQLVLSIRVNFVREEELQVSPTKP